jgi:hypothetical protein
MSSWSQTMRSRNHSLPADWITRPVIRIQMSVATNPHTMRGSPAVLSAVSTIGATRCRCGIGVPDRALQNVSPSTARDAQESRLAGGGNARG